MLALRMNPAMKMAAPSDGKYVPITEATVPLVDAGFLHADAAYDVVTVSRGNFFRLDDHLARMEESSAKFFLENPFNRDRSAKFSTRSCATPA